MFSQRCTMMTSSPCISGGCTLRSRPGHGGELGDVEPGRGAPAFTHAYSFGPGQSVL
jgi:hypothetical protein